MVQYQTASQVASGGASRKRRLGPFIALVALALLGLLLWQGIPRLSGLLPGKGMKGEFLAAEAVPSPDGGLRLWVLTDGSFHYINRVETPGRISVSRECLSCKTWLYIYDPAGSQILSKFRTSYKGLIIHSWMAFIRGRIWVATGPYEKNESRILVYNVEPAALSRQTADVIAPHPELASGLIGLRMERDPDRLILETRDGRTGLVLALDNERLYPSDVEFEKTLAAGDPGTATVFALSEEGSGPRKKLFRVTGPRDKVLSDSLGFMLRNPGSFPSSSQTTAEPLTPDRVYVEGLIFHQDADGCLILHQNAAGPSADRLLTCVSSAGTERWTTAPSDLFKEFRMDTLKDPMSQIFFLKDKIRVTRTGGVVLLQLRGVGAIGFDFGTGRKLWEIKL